MNLFVAGRQMYSPSEPAVGLPMKKSPHSSLFHFSSMNSRSSSVPNATSYANSLDSTLEKMATRKMRTIATRIELKKGS